MKPQRTAKHLRAMVQVRVITHPEVQKRIAIDPQLAPQAGEVIAHERDAAGRNWTILDLDGGKGLEREFRAIVDSLRANYDLGERYGPYQPGQLAGGGFHCPKSVASM